MAAFKRKYGAATTVRVPMLVAGSTNHATGTNWTPASGDVKISKDAGAEANIGTLPAYCVPTDHEILTKRGWTAHNELRVGEPVMVFDPQTHEMRWEPLLGVAEFDYDGELWGLHRRGTGGFWCTPNHRWPYESCKLSARRRALGRHPGMRRGIKEAAELLASDRIPLTGQFVSSDESVLSPRHAAILGWIVTDGHWRLGKKGRGRVPEATIVQSSKKFLEEVVKLTGTAPYPTARGNGVHTVPVAYDDRAEIMKVYGSKGDLPSLVTQLSREAADAMWDAMFQAEGSITNHGSLAFSQDPNLNRCVLEAFQILCLMTGRTLWISNGYNHVARAGVRLQIHRGFTERPFTGRVWCPQTPTGTWIMRHGGAVIPTGNSNGAWTFTLTAAEVTAATVHIRVDDAAVEDQFVLLETYGHASAQHEFDLDAAAPAVNVTQISGDAAAADNLEAGFDGTGYVSALQVAVDANTVLDASIAEPTAVTGWPTTLRQATGWMFALARNRVTQTATTTTLRNDANTANIATFVTSDDNVTFVSDEAT